MAKKKDINKSIITEKDIVFTVVFVRNCGYSAPGKNAKQSKAGMMRFSKSNFSGIKFRKGHRPTITEWYPITKYGDGYAYIKYVFQCGLSGVKEFLRNSGLEYEGRTTALLTDDGAIPAINFCSYVSTDYSSGREREYFKRFGELGGVMYEKQNSSYESACIGVEIPRDRLEEALVSVFKKPLENIKDTKTLNCIQQNFDRLKLAYKSTLEWVKNMSEDCYNFNDPIPAFQVDFREQYLFA